MKITLYSDDNTNTYYYSGVVPHAGDRVQTEKGVFNVNDVRFSSSDVDCVQCFGSYTMTHSRLRALLEEAVVCRGESHKQWYLEQVAAGLYIELPEHEAGVTP